MAKKDAKKTQQPEEGGIVDVARKRYERAKTFYDNSRILAIEDTRFVMGDSDNHWQWPDTIWRNRSQIDQKPCLTINVTAQHCNQIINNIRQNRPAAKVSPVDDFADVETAKILGGMLRAIHRTSNADTAHDIGAEHALYGGEGYWRVITEYEDYNSFDQRIAVKPILNPLLVYIDPDAKEPDRSDAKWGFIFEDISKDQAREEHPNIDPTSWVEDTRYGWVRQETIRRAEYFWCEYHDDTLYLLEDGSTVLQSEIAKEPDYTVVMYGEKEDSPGAIMAGDQLVMGIVFKRKTKRTQWKWAKLLGGEEKPIDERDWPGQFLPIITVVGKELNVNGEVVRKGLVRDLKDPARMVNYAYSGAVESLGLQNKVPYTASAEAIEGYEDIWGQANVQNRAYLPWNEYDDEGRKLTQPIRQQAAQVAVAQVQMLQMSVEQMRAASGQQNANFGIRSEAQSGVGIQRLKAQGEIATFHFPDNLARALKYEAKVILDLIPKVYESKRVIRILGLDGKEESAMLDPGMDQPFVEIKDAEAKVDKIFNPGVGKYDVAIDTGPSYQTQRQEAADAMTELATKFPPLMEVAGDIVMKTYDFPMAEELAERMRKIPSIAALVDDKGDLPPKVMAQIQQMAQQIQAMQQSGEELQRENEELKSKYEIDKDKNVIDAYRAETDRLQAVAPAMGPEAIQAIVMQTVQAILTNPGPEPGGGRTPDEPEPMAIGPTNPEQPPSGGFSLPEEGAVTPPEMAATGANPGLAP